MSYTDADVKALAADLEPMMRAFLTVTAMREKVCAEMARQLLDKGWAKRADVLAPVIGWREYDWPESFDRRTAELIAEHARERNSGNV